MVTLTRSQRRELGKVLELTSTNRGRSVGKPKAKAKSQSTATTKAPPSPIASRPGPQLSFSGHSIDPVIAYSESCVADVRNCDDDRIEEMLRFCKARETRWSESEWNQVLACIDKHLHTQNYARASMMYLLDLLVELIDRERAERMSMAVLVRVALTGPEYLERVCVVLFGRGKIPRILQVISHIIDRLGVRECTGFISEILTKHILLHEDSKFATQFSAELATNFRETFSIESFFVIQICVVHLVRELVNPRDVMEGASRDTLISMLGKFAQVFSHVTSRFTDSTSALLPARVFRVNDKSKDVKFCGLSDCGPSKLQRPQRKDLVYFLDSNNLFECEYCKNLFRKTCDNCASCPIPHCCWGCGYRLVAAGGDQTSIISETTNEKFVGFFLVLSQMKSKEEKQFALMYALDVAKIELGVDRDTLVRLVAAERVLPISAPPFAPSSMFTEEILFKLVLRDKISFLFDLVFKSLIPLLTDSTTATAAGRELKGLSTGPFSHIPGLSEIIFQQIRDARDVRSLNALLGVLEHLGESWEVRGNDVLEIFYIHRRITTWNTKKLIVRIFVSVSDWETPASGELFIDHLTSELDSDWSEMFDQLVESLWGRFGPDASVWSSVIPAIASNCFVRDRFSDALTAHQRLAIASAILRQKKEFETVEFLLGSQIDSVGEDSSLIVNELMHDVLDTDVITSGLLGSLCKAIEWGGTASQLTPSPMHSKVFEKLRREIFLNKQLGVVGGGVRVLVVMTKFFQFTVDLIYEIARICSDTLTRSGVDKEPAAAIRAAVILSSLVEKVDSAVVGEYIIFEWSNCVIGVYDKLPNNVGLSLVCQILCNSGLRESLLKNLPKDFFEVSMREHPDSTIAVVATILESALTNKSEAFFESSPPISRHLSDRPDQGVFCRPLAPLFPSIRDALLAKETNSDTILNSILAINSFVPLGIVNPRSVPSVLMARYVLSCDSSGGLLNTQDLNMFAIRDISPIDNQLIRYTLSSLFTTICEKISSSGIVSEIYRTVELCFPESNSRKRLVNKDGSRFCVDYCVEELVKNWSSTNEDKSLFLCCVLIVGAVSVSCVESVVGRLMDAFGVSEEEAGEEKNFALKFVLSNLQHVKQENLTDRFGWLEDLVTNYREKRFVEVDDTLVVRHEDAIVTRKRARQSICKKGGKRRRKTLSCADEFTSGDSSSDHESVDN